MDTLEQQINEEEVEVEFDREEMLQNQARLNSRWWRINHLYKIVDQDKNLITFKCNPAQKDFYRQVHNEEGKRKYESVIVLKSRQLGFTTFFSIYALDEALFVDNTQALFIAHKVAMAEDIFENKIKRAWASTSEKIKSLYSVDINRSNQIKFTFRNGSISECKVDTSGRSGTISFLHVSELAKLFVELPQRAIEVVTGSFPAVPIGGFKVVESTAEGDYGLFRDLYWNAVDNGEPKTNKEFKAFFYNWRWDYKQLEKTQIIPVGEMKSSGEFKKYQQTHNLTDLEISYYYQKWIDLNQDWNLLRQEYPTTHTEAFVSSGNRFFDTMVLERQPIEKGEAVGDWVVYENYKSHKAYSMGVDPAEGIGKDNAAIVILNTTDGKVAAEFFSNKTEPDILAYEAFKWARSYGMCIVVPERNNHGHAFNQKLRDLGYGNIYTEEAKDTYEDRDTKKLGIHMNSKTKPTLMYSIKTAIETGDVKLASKRLRDQCIRYVKDDLNEEKTRDEWIGHFDGVVALALAWYGRTYTFPYRERDEDEEDDETNPPEELRATRSLW